MPQFIPDASDYLRFKKLQVVQNSNKGNSRPNKINKEREYDADSTILNISRLPFAYQKGMTEGGSVVPSGPTCSDGRYEYAILGSQFVNVSGQYITDGVVRSSLIPFTKNCPFVSIKKGDSLPLGPISPGSEPDNLIFLINCTSSTLIVNGTITLNSSPPETGSIGNNLQIPSGRFFYISNDDNTSTVTYNITVS